MGPADQINVESLAEVRDRLFSKDLKHSSSCPPYSRANLSHLSGAVVEVFHLGRRVRPEDVRQQAAVRDIRWPLDLFELLETLQMGRDAPVGTEDPPADDGRHGQTVEHVLVVGPQLDSLLVLPLALVQEPVLKVDDPGLVIASEEEDIPRVAQLKGHQEGDRLDAEAAPVDVVPHEEVARLRRQSKGPHHLLQVHQLTMEITENGQRSLYPEQSLYNREEERRTRGRPPPGGREPGSGDRVHEARRMSASASSRRPP